MTSSCFMRIIRRTVVALAILTAFPTSFFAQQPQAMCRASLETYVLDKSLNAHWEGNTVVMKRGGGGSPEDRRGDPGERPGDQEGRGDHRSPVQRNNKQAESVAREALLKAREARKKNEETRARLETAGTRSAVAYAAIKNRLARNIEVLYQRITD